MACSHENTVLDSVKSDIVVASSPNAGSQQHAVNDIHVETDVLAIAKEAEGAGFIRKDMLERLGDFPLEVLQSDKFRYLFTDVYKAMKYHKEDFMKILSMLVDCGTQSDDDDFDDCLLCEHYFDLVEILVPYASKWRRIGTALRFKPQELDTIQAKHACKPDGIEQSLMDILGIWVEMSNPTVEELVKALKSQLVGLGSLDTEIKRAVTLKETTSQHLSPYAAFKVYLDYKRRNALQIVPEDSSLLLGVQVTSDAGKFLYYDWLKNGKAIAEPGECAGVGAPFICIPGADIDNMDQYSCVAIDDCVVMDDCVVIDHFTSTSITISVSCPLDNFSDSLISMYLDKPEVPEDTWPPVSSKKFINLALIKQEPINYKKKITQVTIRQDLDDIPLDKEKIEYEEVIGSLKSEQVLFIEGRPEVGRQHLFTKLLKTGPHKRRMDARDH